MIHLQYIRSLIAENKTKMALEELSKYYPNDKIIANFSNHFEELSQKKSSKHLNYWQNNLLEYIKDLQTIPQSYFDYKGLEASIREQEIENDPKYKTKIENLLGQILHRLDSIDIELAKKEEIRSKLEGNLNTIVKLKATVPLTFFIPTMPDLLAIEIEQEIFKFSKKNKSGNKTK